MNNKLGLCTFVLPFVIEAYVFRYNIYSLYVFSLHGWILGLICFATGYIWICNQQIFFVNVKNNVFIFLSIASILYTNRLQNELEVANTLISIESFFWIVSIFGIGARYLNKDRKWLKYLKEAVFPVYVFHLPL
jgi:glucan biosynthesis protein C